MPQSAVDAICQERGSFTGIDSDGYTPAIFRKVSGNGSDGIISGSGIHTNGWWNSPWAYIVHLILFPGCLTQQPARRKQAVLLS